LDQSVNTGKLLECVTAERDNAHSTFRTGLLCRLARPSPFPQLTGGDDGCIFVWRLPADVEAAIHERVAELRTTDQAAASGGLRPLSAPAAAADGPARHAALS